MDDYLKKCRQFVNDNVYLSSNSNVLVALGNESADLDSIGCSLTLAYFLSKHVEGEFVLPVINIPRSELRYRKDVLYVLNSAFNKFTDDVESLLVFRDELDLNGVFEKGKLKLALVDHSELAPSQTRLSPVVALVIDHHQQGRNPLKTTPLLTWTGLTSPSKSIDNRIEPVGSCCTLVAETIAENDPSVLTERSVGLLLYAGILVDTYNFNEKLERTTAKDKHFAGFIKEMSLNDIDKEQLYLTITAAKSNVDGLTIEDILAKDFKCVKSDKLSIGTSSVLVPAKVVIDVESGAKSDLERFCTSRNLDVLVILSVIKSNDSSTEIKRQLAIYSKNDIYRDQIVDTLFNDERLAGLDLTPNFDSPNSNSDSDVIVFDQHNVRMSRKQILPALETFLGGFGASPKVAKEGEKIDDKKFETENFPSSARRFIESHGLDRSFSVTYDDSATPSQGYSPDETPGKLSPLVNHFFDDSTTTATENRNVFLVSDFDPYSAAIEPTDSFLQQVVTDAIESSQLQLENEFQTTQINTTSPVDFDSLKPSWANFDQEKTNMKTPETPPFEMEDSFLDSSSIVPSHVQITSTDFTDNFQMNFNNNDDFDEPPSPMSPFGVDSDSASAAEYPRVPPNTFAQPFGGYMEQNLLSPAQLRGKFGKLLNADNSKPDDSCPPTPPNSFLNSPKVLFPEQELPLEHEKISNELRKLSDLLPNETFFPNEIEEDNSSAKVMDNEIRVDNDDDIPPFAVVLSNQEVEPPPQQCTPVENEAPVVNGPSFPEPLMHQVVEKENVEPLVLPEPPIEETTLSAPVSVPLSVISDSESDFAPTPRSKITDSSWEDDDYPELLEIYQRGDNGRTLADSSRMAAKSKAAAQPTVQTGSDVAELRHEEEDRATPVFHEDDSAHALADEKPVSEKGDDLEWENDTPVVATPQREGGADWNVGAAELAEERRWKNVTINGVEHRIDTTVVEPYRKVITHGDIRSCDKIFLHQFMGIPNKYLIFYQLFFQLILDSSDMPHWVRSGYYGDGLNAVIVFAACYLPSRHETNYRYIMDNLFLYTVSVLDALVAEDYVIIFFQGGATGDQMPSFSWLRKCYRLIDSRLRKNLKRLMLVHATLWLKTVITMTKPFISSKFSKKIFFVPSLEELSKMVPLDQVSIPEPVEAFDKTKSSRRRTDSQS